MKCRVSVMAPAMVGAVARKRRRVNGRIENILSDDERLRLDLMSGTDGSNWPGCGNRAALNLRAM